MHKDLARILLTEEQIRNRIRELGEEISRDYAGKCPVFVGVLKGVIIFFSDMVRAVDGDCQFDFMCLSSYGSSTCSSGTAVVKQDLTGSVEGRDVIILEDVFDTGTSLQTTYEYLLSRNPASLRICTLLDKPGRRKAGITVKADYTGFVIPDEFVVGYGLDYGEKYRNLPYIGVLKPEVYTK